MKFSSWWERDLMHFRKEVARVCVRSSIDETSATRYEILNSKASSNDQHEHYSETRVSSPLRLVWNHHSYRSLERNRANVFDLPRAHVE
ncbi:MAG TPA: hypothetical protein VIB00_14405 [Pyrinomonadaceae bacterium]